MAKRDEPDSTPPTHQVPSAEETGDSDPGLAAGAVDDSKIRFDITLHDKETINGRKIIWMDRFLPSSGIQAAATIAGRATFAMYPNMLVTVEDGKWFVEKRFTGETIEHVCDSTSDRLVVATQTRVLEILGGETRVLKEARPPREFDAGARRLICCENGDILAMSSQGNDEHSDVPFWHFTEIYEDGEWNVISQSWASLTGARCGVDGIEKVVLELDHSEDPRTNAEYSDIVSTIVYESGGPWEQNLWWDDTGFIARILPRSLSRPESSVLFYDVAVGKWETQIESKEHAFERIWGLSRNDIFVLTRDGLILHHDQGLWKEEKAGVTTARLAGDHAHGIYLIGNHRRTIQSPRHGNKNPLGSKLMADDANVEYKESVTQVLRHSDEHGWDLVFEEKAIDSYTTLVKELRIDGKATCVLSSPWEIALLDVGGMAEDHIEYVRILRLAEGSEEYIWDYTMDEKGGIWVLVGNTYGSNWAQSESTHVVYHENGDRLGNYKINDPETRYDRINILADGSVVINNTNSAAILDDGTFTPICRCKGKKCAILAALGRTASNVYLLDESRGILEKKNNKWSPIKGSPRGIKQGYRITEDGSVLIVTAKEILTFAFEGDELRKSTSVELPEELMGKKDRVWLDGSGHLIVGGEDGVVLCEGNDCDGKPVFSRVQDACFLDDGNIVAIDGHTGGIIGLWQ